MQYKRNGKHVACLTYTNAAVEVIASRIFSDSFIIPSTIHSFAWENIQNFRSSLVVAAKELDFIPSDHTVEEVKRVVYDLGIRYLEEDGTLHLFHDDIIKIFAWFLDKEKFRMLLSDKYPLILIDEYQDTFKIITDKFLTYFKICNIPNFGKTIHRCRKYCYMKYRNYLKEMMCALQMLEAKFGDVLEKYPPFSKEWEEEKRTAISILASIK